MRDVDEAWIELRQRGVTKPQLVHRSGLEVFAEDVGAAQKLVHDFQPTWIFYVDGDALLVAVESAEEACAGTSEGTRAVASNRLHLDHLCSEICEHHPARRTHHHVGHLDHTDAAIRQRLILLQIIHCATPVRQPSGCTALGLRPSAYLNPLGRPAS